MKPSPLPTERRDLSTVFPAVILALVACAVYSAVALYVLGGPGLPLDDSWIHLHFARQISDGHGLSFHTGEPMPASTAPLWTALLALGFGLGLPPILWSWFLGSALFVAAVVGTDRLAAEIGCSQGGRRLASILVASSHWLIWSALSGMEISLFLCLSLWGLAHHLRESRDPSRTPVSLPLLACATLARPEGFLLLALVLASSFLTTERHGPRLLGRLRWPKRLWWVSTLAAVSVVLPALIYQKLYGGSFLPTTFAVKASTPDLVPDGRYLRTVLDIFFRSQPWMLLFAGTGVIRLVARVGRPAGPSLVPALWLLGLPLAYSLLTPEDGPRAVGNFGRYYFPLLPVLVIFGVYGLEPLGRRLARSFHLGPLRIRLLPLALLVLLAPQIWTLVHGPLRYTQTVANVEDSDVAAAQWLQARLPEDALLATQDIGALKFHVPNRILDLAGLVNPEILPVLRQGSEYWEDRLYRYLESRRPDYLVVFPQSYPRLVARPGFDVVQTFEIEDNVTMAGEVLVIFQTPWCRAPIPNGP